MLSATVLITLLTRKQRPCRLTQLVLEQLLHRGMDGGKSVCLLQSWLGSLIWHTAWLHLFSSHVSAMWFTKESLGNLSIHADTYCASYQWSHSGLRLRLLKDSDLCKPMPMSVSICFPARCEPYESGLHATHARYRPHPSTGAVHSVCQEPAWRHLARNLLQHHHSPSGQSGSWGMPCLTWRA